MSKIKLFGTTISETIEAFSRHNNSNGVHTKVVELSGRAAKGPSKSRKTTSKSQVATASNDNSKLIAIGRICLSVMLVLLATYLFTVDNKSDTAMAIVGFVAGYWLK